MAISNPFALIRASDYTDEQINSLWVELGSRIVEAIIEPHARASKFILGGKGTGKTHLLRYYSFQAVRLRSAGSGISILGKQQFLGIFLRATTLDAARFEMNPQEVLKWQQLFGIYLELRLVEGVLDAMQEIKNLSPEEIFDDQIFVSEIGQAISEEAAVQKASITDLLDWVVRTKRDIDDKVNNAPFVDEFDFRAPFAIGSLCLPISKALQKWHKALADVPLIYMIDEVENFTERQQQVVNSLIRYGEGRATFRVTGRLYARKTFATLADGEENREGSEFKTTILDDILRDHGGYPKFARKFVAKRLGPLISEIYGRVRKEAVFDPASRFESISSVDHYTGAVRDLGIDREKSTFKSVFEKVLAEALVAGDASIDGSQITELLTDELPYVLQKLNILLFCKRHKKGGSFLEVAERIRDEAIRFVSVEKMKGSYKTAYGHWAGDLFAQLCKESKKRDSVPYAGFDTFVRMSSGNPRNLLVILNRAYEIATFRELGFVSGPKLSLGIQTKAALDAARFMYESDTNYGGQSEQARTVVNRLGTILRTARYALNIPEVSPLAVSFVEGDLSVEGRKALCSALNYSFVFEIHEGRADRNVQQRRNRKIQLNPLLSPLWELPVGRRGDIGLDSDMAHALFDPDRGDEFKVLLKIMQDRWNHPFSQRSCEARQGQLEL